MDYEVVLLHVNKSIIGPGGVVEPLCNSCLTPDCTNPIREQSISIMGVVKKVRLHVVGNIFRQVVECKGYVGDKYLPQTDTPKFETSEIPEDDSF
jgi:hypothetical protein